MKCHWILALAFLFSQSGSAQVCPVERVSVNNSGQAAEGDCLWADVSGDGGVVVFVTRAANLGGPTLGHYNVFARMRHVGQTVRVTTATIQLPNGPSSYPRVSADGRWVAFQSDARNLIHNDTNDRQDVFVRDLAMSTTQLVSRAAQGSLGNAPSGAPAISSDGAYVAFDSSSVNLVVGDGNNVGDVFVKHVPSGAIELVSVGPGGFESNGPSRMPEISSDGAIVAFESLATNLGGAPAGWFQIYVRDRNAGTTEIVSVDPGGVPADAHCHLDDLSADGRYVLFHSRATNLDPGLPAGPWRAWLRDRQQGQTILVARNTLGEPAGGDAFGTTIGGSGPWISFSGNLTNLNVDGQPWDAGWVRDLSTGFTVGVVRNYAGSAQPVGGAAVRLSEDGTVGVFSSSANDVVPGPASGWSQIYTRSICGWFATVCGSWPTATACPCGNEGSPGSGCGNSVADAGAGIRAVGTPSVGGDTLRLEAWNMPRSTTVRFLQSDRRVATIPFGDGTTCLGQPVRILGSRRAELGGAIFGGDVAGDPPLSVLGSIPTAGALRFYQAIYRDQAQFCTTEAASATNAIAIQWGP